MRILKKFLCFALVISLVGGSVPVRANDLVAKLISIHEVTGTDVKFTKGSAKEFRARDGTKLFDGYTVSTGKDSHAYLRMDDESVIKLDEKSSVSVAKLSRNRLSVNVLSGGVSVYAAAQKSGDTFEIRAGNSALAVRGTSFIFENNDDDDGKDEVNIHMLTGLGDVNGELLNAGESMTVHGTKNSDEKEQTKKNLTLDDDLSLFTLNEIKDNKDELKILGILSDGDDKKIDDLIAKKEKEKRDAENISGGQGENQNNNFDSRTPSPSYPSDSGGGGYYTPQYPAASPTPSPSPTPTLPIEILSAAIYVAPPVKGAPPARTAQAAGNFAVGAVTWNPGEDIFLGGAVYTAEVTLRADEGFFFGANFSAIFGGINARILQISNESVTLAATFAPTFEREITSVSIVSQPNRTVYTHGEILNLDGLQLFLRFDDDTEEIISRENFAAYNILTTPSHGAILSRQFNNTFGVVISQNGGTTVPLTVYRADPIIETLPTASDVILDTPLRNSILVGGIVRGTAGEILAGEWNWLNGNLIVDISGTYFAQFLPYDSNYEPIPEEIYVTASPATLTRISINAQPNNLTYTVDEELNLTGLSVLLEYNNGNSRVVLLNNFADEGIETNPPNGTTLTLAQNGLPVTVSLGIFTTATSNMVVTTTTLIPIENVRLTVIPPQVGATPNSNPTGSGNFEMSSVHWNPIENPFEAGKPYAAVILLDALPGYVFANPLDARINDLPGTTATVYPDGDRVQISYTFPAIFATEITINNASAPANFSNRTHGEILDLSWLVATVSYDNGFVREIVFANFAANGITTSLENGAILTVANDNQRVIVSLDGTTHTAETAAINVSPTEISLAAISVTAPIAGNPPDTNANIIGDANFTVGAVRWSPEENNFLGGEIYTARVNLLADEYFYFTNSLVATMNGNNAFVENISADGSEATILFAFDPTDTATPTGISVNDIPAEFLNYTHGGTLDLSWLIATVSMSDGTPREIMFADFAANGIETNYPNGVNLIHTEHDARSISVSILGTVFSATTTNNLAVARAQISSAEITVTPPMKGQPPDNEAGAIANAANDFTLNFSLGEALWSPEDNPFLGGEIYTARVTITANQNFIFASALAATINGNAANVSVDTASGNEFATVSFAFDATDDADLVSVNVASQPEKISYVHGEKFDLNGFALELIFDDGETEIISFDELGNFNILTLPAHDEILFSSLHNKPFDIWYGNDASIAVTSPLTVEKAVPTIESVPTIFGAEAGNTHADLTLGNGGVARGTVIDDADGDFEILSGMWTMVAPAEMIPFVADVPIEITVRFTPGAEFSPNYEQTDETVTRIPTEAADPIQNYLRLADALDEADAALSDADGLQITFTSVDGADIPALDDVFWISQERMVAFINLIFAAQEILSDAIADIGTQTLVDETTENLQAATEIFTNTTNPEGRKLGLLNVSEILATVSNLQNIFDELDSQIQNGEVKLSTNGNDVSSDENWVDPDRFAALEAHISAAKTDVRTMNNAASVATYLAVLRAMETEFSSLSFGNGRFYVDGDDSVLFATIADALAAATTQINLAASTTVEDTSTIIPAGRLFVVDAGVTLNIPMHMSFRGGLINRGVIEKTAAIVSVFGNIFENYGTLQINDGETEFYSCEIINHGRIVLSGANAAISFEDVTFTNHAKGDYDGDGIEFESGRILIDETNEILNLGDIRIGRIVDNGVGVGAGGEILLMPYFISVFGGTMSWTSNVGADAAIFFAGDLDFFAQDNAFAQNNFCPTTFDADENIRAGKYTWIEISSGNFAWQNETPPPVDVDALRTQIRDSLVLAEEFYSQIDLFFTEAFGEDEIPFGYRGIQESAVAPLRAAITDANNLVAQTTISPQEASDVVAVLNTWTELPLINGTANVYINLNDEIFLPAFMTIDEAAEAAIELRDEFDTANTIEVVVHGDGTQTLSIDIDFKTPEISLTILGSRMDMGISLTRLQIGTSSLGDGTGTFVAHEITNYGGFSVTTYLDANGTTINNRGGGTFSVTGNVDAEGATIFNISEEDINGIFRRATIELSFTNDERTRRANFKNAVINNSGRFVLNSTMPSMGIDRPGINFD
ncbi:MAG: FecR family protein, partial [Defluviitaleaceae bacterium]|nr:FecR family protein [Defluviitaleaceae bacterium]